MAENRFIGDMHLGHSNVLNFDNRPFKTITEHDQTLIRNWNEVVGPRDTTYILGDFCWLTEKYWGEILDKLNGKKFLIKGNHDLKTMTTSTQNRFIGIKDIHSIKYEGKRIIMCHYPLMSYPTSQASNCYMLHAHTHLSKEQELIEKWTKEIAANTVSYGHIINVGCMMPWMNYYPRTLEEIIEGWKKECETKIE